MLLELITKNQEYNRQYGVAIGWNHIPMVLFSLKNILLSMLQTISPYSNRWEPNSLNKEDMVTAATRFQAFYDNLE